MNTRNINLGKNNSFYFLVILLSHFFIFTSSIGDQIDIGKNVDIKILDKLSSKNKLLNVKVGEDYIFKNLALKVLKCQNSKFDDNPEITSYLQVRDLNNKNNNEVFIFNGWTFSSSPSIQAFDHPVYDLWILKCY